MANKASIQNSINSIDDGGLNTAEEVRTVLDNMLNEGYSDVIIDTETTTNVFTAVDTNSEYKIKINKQGRKVTLNIVIECINNYIGGDIAEITNTEFLPDEDTLFFDSNFSATGSIFEYYTDSGDTLVVSIIRDNIAGYTLSFTSNSNVLFEDQIFKGQLTYFTKD